MNSHSRPLRLTLGFIGFVAVAVFLVGCTPPERTALRLNNDGSIDFVSCVAVDEVSTASATTTLRTGPNGTADDSTANSVNPDRPIEHLDAGQIVTFRGLPDHWDRLDVSVDGVGERFPPYAVAERHDLTVGEWRWMDQDSVIPSPKSRCHIDDSKP